MRVLHRLMRGIAAAPVTSFALTLVFATLSTPVLSLVSAVTPSSSLTPVAAGGNVSFLYTPEATSIGEVSANGYYCTALSNPITQSGGAFPSGPTPLTISSFCAGTQIIAPGTANITLVAAASGSETFPVNTASFAALVASVGYYGTVYYVRDWIDEFSLQTFTVSRLQLSRNVVPVNDVINVTTGSAANVLANDLLDGSAATAANVVLSIVDNGGMGGLSVAGGQLQVPAATASGTYTVTYRICDAAPGGGSNCGTALATLVVASPFQVIATADIVAVPFSGGLINILANDTVGGVRATLGNATLSLLSSGGLSEAVIQGDGQIRVVAQRAGQYSLPYRICSLAAPAICATTVATITVIQPSVVANQDSSSLPAGGGRITVLSNDFYEGSQASLSNVVLSIVNAAGLRDITVGSNGDLVIPAAAIGSYTITYRICASASIQSCADANVFISIVPPTLAIKDDKFTIPDLGGSIRILQNDTIDGATASLSNAIVSVVSGGGLVGIAINNDSGELVIPPAESGTYFVVYRVCSKFASSICGVATATVTLSVTARQLRLANDVVVAASVGATFNVVANDTVGARPVDASNASISLVQNGGIQGLSLSNDGLLTIPPISAGVYRPSYRVCQKNLADNCSEATVRITVTQGAGVVGISNPRTPPSVPGATMPVVSTLTGGSSPIVFSQAIPASAGGAGSPLVLGETRLGYGVTSANSRYESYRADDAFEPFGAQFQYSGSGSINYRWEIVRPGDSLPTQIDLFPAPSLSLTDQLRQTRFTEISRGQIYLPPVGRLFMRGPNPNLLPRELDGTYLILLRIEASTTSANGPTNGASAFPIQPLTYVLSAPRETVVPPGTTETSPENGSSSSSRRPLSGRSSVAEFSNMGQLADGSIRLSGGALRARPIGETWKTLSPPSVELIGANAQSNDRFTLSWKPLVGAKTYRVTLEVKTALPQDERPSRIVLVARAGLEQGFQLRQHVLTSLRDRGALRWRIDALNEEGKLIAQSDWGTISSL